MDENRQRLLGVYVQSFLELCEYDGDDEETIEAIYIQICRQRRLHRGRRQFRRIPRIEGYVERLISQFTIIEFKEHFRLLPETFEFILGQIHHLLVRSYNGTPMISPKKQLLIAIWRMATPDSYRSIIQRFNVGKATAIRAVRRVTRALKSLAPTFIKWPEDERAERIVACFRHASNFPGVIGAIDGTHINIPAPKEYPGAYVNRKNRHSIHLQAVSDHECIFTHCFTGNVGSVHDARVFGLSSVNNYITDDAKFPNDTHLLGDAAYALHLRLLVPYLDNGHLTDQQRNFNYLHSSARMAIERAFCLLKGRWRSLLDVLAMDRTDLIPNHIIACCVLHNICLLKRDELETYALEGTPEVAQPMRNVINADGLGRQAAVAKRDRIAAELRV